MHAQSCPTLCDPWTAASEAPLSTALSRQEYSSRLTFPIPGKMTTGVKKRTVHDEKGSKQGYCPFYCVRHFPKPPLPLHPRLPITCLIVMAESQLVHRVQHRRVRHTAHTLFHFFTQLTTCFWQVGPATCGVHLATFFSHTPPNPRALVSLPVNRDHQLTFTERSLHGRNYPGPLSCMRSFHPHNIWGSWANA